MHRELLLLVAGISITFFAAVVALIEKLSKVAESKDELVSVKAEKRFAGWIFISVILGLALTLISGIFNIIDKKESDKKNQKLNDSLFHTEARLVELSKLQLDTALRIIALGNKLSAAQNQIIVFQEDALQQVTGGANKPILSFAVASTVNYSVDNSKVITIIPKITLTNIGKTYLKDVESWVETPYTDDVAEIISESDNSFRYYRNDTDVHKNFDHSSNMFLFDAGQKSLMKTTYNDLKTLSPYEYKEIYSLPLPRKATYINFKIKVAWSNGSYNAILKGRIIDKMLYARDIMFSQNDKPIVNERSFFNIPSQRTPRGYISAGKVNYHGDKYDIYWSSITRQAMGNRVGSIFYLAYPNTLCNKPSEAAKSFKKCLLKVFGP